VKRVEMAERASASHASAEDYLARRAELGTRSAPSPSGSALITVQSSDVWPVARVARCVVDI